MASSEQVVRDFCAAWSDLDLDRLLSFFTDDVVYHNIPMEPIVGKDAIRAFVEGFTGGVERIEFQVLHAVADGDVVLTERVDTFFLPGRSVALGVMGVFELRDGLIAAWRDYFDLAQLMTQLAG